MALIKNLLAYYQCNETSGMIVNDAAGAGRHLTVTSPGGGITTAAAGKIGATSFAWTGLSGTASITNPVFLPGTAVTAMMWVKLSLTSGNQTFMGVGTNALAGAEPWRLRKDSFQNRYQFQIRGGGTTVVGGRTAQGTLVPNTTDWVLLVGGYNQATSTVWLSENGGPKVVTNVSPSDYWPIRQDFTTLHLGSMNATDWSRSLMNEAGVWNRELSSADIAELWNGGAGQVFTNFSGRLGPIVSPQRALHQSNEIEFGALLSQSAERGEAVAGPLEDTKDGGTLVGVCVSPSFGGGSVRQSIIPGELPVSQRLLNMEYDAARVFFQLYDRTSNAAWLASAQLAINAYRDEYLAPFFATSSYPTANQQYPHGLYQDWIRNNSIASRDALITLATAGDITRSAAFLSTTNVSTNSRRTANTISTLILHEQIGGTRHSKFFDFINQALGHIEQWCIEKTIPAVGPFSAQHTVAPYVRPFEVAVTCEALIEAYEYLTGPAHATLRDEILYHVNIAIDYCWATCWDPIAKAFRYADRFTGNSFDLTPSPTHSMLIAPVFAWIWRTREYEEYAARCLQIIEGGVSVYTGASHTSGANFGGKTPSTVNGRTVVQNYRWTTRMWQWLDANFLPAAVPPHILLGIASSGITTDNPEVMISELGDYPNIVENYKFFPKRLQQHIQIDTPQGNQPDTVSPWPWKMMDHAKALGALPVITWEVWRFDNTGTKGTIAVEEFEDRLDNYDQWLEYYAKRIREYGDPVVLRIGHEMNLKRSIADGGYPWGEPGDVFDGPAHPARYIRLMRYIVTRMRYHGAYNAFYNWCVLHTDVPTTSPQYDFNRMQNYWPGRDVVDIGGADGYSGGNTPPRTYTQIWAESDARFVAHVPEFATLIAPYLVAETNASDFVPTNFVIERRAWLDWWLDACAKAIEQQRWTCLFFARGAKNREILHRFLKHPKSGFVRNSKVTAALPAKNYEVTTYNSWSISNQRVYRDGHAFFAMGWYYSSDYTPYVESEVDALFDAGANLIYAPTDFNAPIIDHVERRGGAMLIEMNSGDPNGVVAQYKDRPCVLGYFTFDDIDNHTAAAVLAASNARKAIAPNKLPYGSGGFSPNFGNTYVNKVDILSFQNYPINNDPHGVFGSWNTYLQWIAPAANAAGQCWWANAQGFSWMGTPFVVFPNFVEMRNCHWQPIMQGATGLLYYAAYGAQNPWVRTIPDPGPPVLEKDEGTDQRPDLQPGWMAEWTQLAKETKELQAFFLYGVRSTLPTTFGSRNAARMWTLQNKRLIIAINFQNVDTGNNGTCSITVPPGLSAKTAPYAARYGDGFTLLGTTLSGTLDESQVRIMILTA